MKILLVIPPFTQLNTPYPSVPYLANFLRASGHEVIQIDLGIYTVRKLFSLSYVKELLEIANPQLEHCALFLAQRKRWLDSIEAIVQYIDGNYPEFETLVQKGFLPKTLRERQATELLESELSIQDQTKFHATLVLEELADIINSTVDSNFSLVRYDNALAPSLGSFEHLEIQVLNRTSLCDIYLNKLTTLLKLHDFDLAGFTLPFPGTLVGALQCMQRIRDVSPRTRICAGGGYVSTELREIASKKFFSYCDYLLFDSGEIPLKFLIDYLENRREKSELVRTAALEDDCIVLYNFDSSQRDFSRYWPDYEGLDMKEYLSLYDTPNKTLRLWSERKWIKLAFAYGCYWAKCAFCDGSLDYIGTYVPFDPLAIVDRMDALCVRYGNSFHFVDEAAPPALLKKVAIELIKRGRRYTWWTNIRFEKSFSEGLCRLLSLAGCIAVSGGIEIAENKGLRDICKGLSLETIAKTTHNFAVNDILVHTYLIHGFPGETDQQTADSLEAVRQLFAAGCIHSGFWHRFALTAHSPFYARLKTGKKPKTGTFDFALNDIHDPSLRAPFEVQLRRALYNYMHGVMLEKPISFWLQMQINPTLQKNAVKKMIQINERYRYALWAANIPVFIGDKDGRNGKCVVSTNDLFLQVEMKCGQFNKIIEMYNCWFSDYRFVPVERYHEIKSANQDSLFINFLGFLENRAILFM